MSCLRRLDRRHRRLPLCPWRGGQPGHRGPGLPARRPGHRARRAAARRPLRPRSSSPTRWAIRWPRRSGRPGAGIRHTASVGEAEPTETRRAEADGARAARPSPSRRLTDGTGHPAPAGARRRRGRHRACSDPDTQQWLDLLPRPYLRERRAMVHRPRPRDWQTGHAAVFAIADATTTRSSVPPPSRLAQAATHSSAIGSAPGRAAGASHRGRRARQPLGHPELGIARLELFVEAGNVASERVAEKAGFQREGSSAPTTMAATAPSTWSCSRCCRPISRPD